MAINKLYTYKSEQQIWRILLTDSDQFVIETRDAATKEVFFNCIDAYTGKTVFRDYQFSEKSWIGIEAVYKDVIFFHKYAQPDLPGHKEIICFETASQKILWTNNSLTFMFVYNGQAAASVETFEGRRFYLLDYKTGMITADLGENPLQINRMKNMAEEEKDYSQYKFTDKISKETIKNLEGAGALKDLLRNLDIVEDVEYTSYKDYLLVNFHQRENGNNLRNRFAAVDLISNEVVFEETLNSNSKVITPDSFFVYRDILILLREKDQIIICRFE